MAARLEMGRENCGRDVDFIFDAVAFLYSFDLREAFACQILVSGRLRDQIEQGVDLVFQHSPKITDRSDSMPEVEIDEAPLVQLGILGAESLRKLRRRFNRQSRPLTHFNKDVVMLFFLPDELVVLLTYAAVPALVVTLLNKTGREIHLLTVYVPPRFSLTLFVLAIHP